MTITNTTKATLDWSQKRNWQEANWGAFTRSANEKVANVLIAMLEEGIDLNLLKDSYKFMDEVERRSGVSEITDTDARDCVCSVLRWVVENDRIPTLRPDFHTDEDDLEDEDDWYSWEDWTEEEAQ
jgi:hypothetical protein